MTCPTFYSNSRKGSPYSNEVGKCGGKGHQSQHLVYEGVLEPWIHREKVITQPEVIKLTEKMRPYWEVSDLMTKIMHCKYQTKTVKY